MKLRPSQDHVCQDQVFQDHVCQDHGFQDHVSQDHVFLSRPCHFFKDFFFCLIQSDPITYTKFDPT